MGLARFLVLLATSLLIQSCWSDTATKYSGSGFSHMEVYSIDSQDYLVVAQTNSLVRLSSDLSRAEVTHIGPVNDSLSCAPLQVLQSNPEERIHCSSIQSMDNHVRAMDIKDDRLYFCMSYLSGSCTSVQLGAVNTTLSINLIAIAAKLKDSLGIFCRTPEIKILLTVAARLDDSKTIVPDGLYLSMPYCVTGLKVEPILSIVDSRSLQQFAKNKNYFGASNAEVVPIDPKVRLGILTYHLSFSRRSAPGNCQCVYFVLIATDPGRRLQIRNLIGRLCSADLYLERYTEVFLECGSEELVADAATVAKPGKRLATSLSIPPDDDQTVLFLSVGHRNGTGGGVCTFPLFEIDRQLDRVFAECRRGGEQTFRGLSYLRDERRCLPEVESITRAIEQSTCDQPTGSQSAFQGTFSRNPQHVVRADILVNRTLPGDISSSKAENVTAIAALAMTGTEETLVYLGTSKGRLIANRVASSSEPYAIWKTEGLKPQAVLAVRTGRDRVFAMTSSEVVSRLYAECEKLYSTCETCLGSNNPHCVWSNLPGSQGGCRTLLPADPIVSGSGVLTDSTKCLRVAEMRENYICVDNDTNLTENSIPGLHSVLLIVRNIPDTQPQLQIYCQQIDDMGITRGDSKVVTASVGLSTGVSAILNCTVALDDMSSYLEKRTSRRLSLRLSTGRHPSDPQLATVSVLVFTCQRRFTCSDCTTSSSRESVSLEGASSRCTWCSFRGVCMHRLASNAGLKTGDVEVDGNSFVSDRSMCPSVRLKASESTSSGVALVPSGVAGDQKLVYDFSGLQPFMRSFGCTVICPNSNSVYLPAYVTKGQLTCQTAERQPLEYSNLDATNITCRVDFHWTTVEVTSENQTKPEPNKRLDAIHGADILVLYKCQAMGPTCDACVLRTPARFGCVWCDAACSPASSTESCPTNSLTRNGGLCSHPQLDTVEPVKLVPVRGLIISAVGRNLGNSPESLAARLVPKESGSTESFECGIIPESYVPGRSFRCRVSEAPSLAAGGYKLEVTVLGITGGTNAVTKSYHLPVQTPIASSLSANIVQQHGRPIVYLEGRHLNAGSDLRVVWRLIGSNETIEAEVIDRQTAILTMRLKDFSIPGLYSPELSIQGTIIILEGNVSAVILKVTPDSRPIVDKADRRTGLIPSGGLNFSISGDNLDSVQSSIMRFTELQTSNLSSGALLELKSKCFLAPTPDGIRSRLICPSPIVPLNGSGRQRRSTKISVPHRLFSVTLQLDSLEHPYSSDALKLYSDPRFEPLPRKLSTELYRPPSAGKQQQQDLQLLAKGVLLALKNTDIRVAVGASSCIVVRVRSIDPSQFSGADEIITCRFRLAGEVVGVALPVRVTVGRLTFDLGDVTFTTEFPWTMVYIGTVVGSMLLLALLLAVCLHAYQRSRKRRDKAKNGIEVHLNKLEAKVSKTCREAFAELQLNSCPEVSGADPAMSQPPPVRSFAQFVAYSCFGDRYRDRHRTNDCLFFDVATEDATNSQDSTEVRRALGQLRNLLQNEDFLLTMIAAMESRTDKFNHQERNHFGSLVSAFLFTDPSYFTRILTQLIRGLISRKEEAKDNYKVTFRRCDSVAEKLLPTWLAFHMYNHLSQQVAEPLYRLHREMRVQIYRGPVDQVTEDSRYTINEQKLLKKEIPFKALTLSFHDRLRIFSGDDQLQCKVTVLDCDTVQQAKEKILDAVYSRLGVPASQRNRSDQYDLVRVPAVATPQGDNSRPIPDALQVLPEFDEVDGPETSDSLQRLRRLSCLTVGEEPTGPYWVYLRPRKNANSSIESTRRGLSKGASYADIGSLPSGVSSKSLQDMKHFSSSYNRIAAVGSAKQYHLLPPSGGAGHPTLDRGGNKKRRHRQLQQQLDGTEGDNPILSEILYPILLSTKKNLVAKITSLFEALFPTIQQHQQQQQGLQHHTELQQQSSRREELEYPLPDLQQLEHQHLDHQQAPHNLHCLTYLFSLIDELASDKCDSKSTDVSHVWKSNALMLRFYTHHLLNVEYLLDIDVPGPVRYCMTTVSTLFMDACSAERPKKPDKTSTAQRLLFYSEIAQLHARVEAFYSALRASSAATPDELVLPNTCQPFNSGPLLKEVFTCFVFKYYDDIVRQLQHHQPCVSDSLIASLLSVMQQLGSDSPMQQQQYHQLQQQQYSQPQYHQMSLHQSGTRDRKKRSNSRPGLDTNAYDY